MPNVTRRTLLTHAGAAIALSPLGASAASAASPAATPSPTSPHRPLLLLLADYSHKERDFTTQTLGSMAKANGVAFEAYLATDHGDGGIFSAHGSTLLGGRHEVALGRAFAEFQTTVLYLGDTCVFTSLVNVGAVQVLRAESALAAAQQVMQAFAWRMPQTVVAIQTSQLPPELVDMTPYLTPEVIHRQAIALPLEMPDGAVQQLWQMGIRNVSTIAVQGQVPPAWTQQGFTVESAEELQPADTLFAVTRRVAKRWLAQSRGIDLCEPVMAAHWVPFSIREDRLQMCSRPTTKEAIEGIVELAQPWPDPVVYGRWGGGGVKGVGDFGLFPLFRKGLSVEISEPGRPVLTVFSKSPVPIAQPAQTMFDLEPTDDQLQGWADAKRILVTYVLHSGELSHDDAVQHFIETSGSRKIPIGMSVHWQRYAFEPWSVEATQIPQAQGGALGLVEPVLHSTGQGIMAEGIVSPAVVAGQMKDARARIAKVAGERFVPRGVYCFDDADMKNWDSPAPQLWNAIQDQGFEYVISSVANGENRVLQMSRNFLVLNMVGQRADASPFVRQMEVEMPNLEKKLKAAGQPGWLLGVLDSPLYGYSPYVSAGQEWGLYVRLSQLYDYIQKGAKERDLVPATPRTIARYARILAERKLVPVGS